MKKPLYRLALFDLDHTLLPLDSDHGWGEFTMQIGWCDRAEFGRRNDAFFQDYLAGRLDIHDYVRFATEAVVQRGPQAAAQTASARWRAPFCPAAFSRRALRRGTSPPDAEKV